MKKKEKDADDALMFASAQASAAPPARSELISPLDIQQKEFRVSRFGGYRMRDVDEFLDQLTDAMTSVIAENERLRGTGSAAPVLGTPDLDDVGRQADEIIQRARDEAGRIIADARQETSEAGVADTSAPASPTAADRAAVSAFLTREKEFLQSLAGLVQGHAESVKSMAKAARPAPATAPRPGPPSRSHSDSSPKPGGKPAPGAPPVPSGAAPAAPEQRGPEPQRGPAPQTERAVEIHQAEEPVLVDRPEPAVVRRGKTAKESTSRDDSLRELFWGED